MLFAARFVSRDIVFQHENLQLLQSTCSRHPAKPVDLVQQAQVGIFLVADDLRSYVDMYGASSEPRKH